MMMHPTRVMINDDKNKILEDKNYFVTIDGYQLRHQ